MSKIISLKLLSKLLTTHYSLLTTVLVTGCFDLLHQAHKDFLIAAKQQGDLLIVGLESDKRVKQLKGKTRPFNKYQIRAENLVKLIAVDYVFPLPEKFSNAKDHLKLLYLIKPTILAVSSNTPHLKEKEQITKKLGIQLFIFPINPNYSTTSLLTTLRDTST